MGLFILINYLKDSKDKNIVNLKTKKIKSSNRNARVVKCQQKLF